MTVMTTPFGMKLENKDINGGLLRQRVLTISLVCVCVCVIINRNLGWWVVGDWKEEE